MKFFRNFGLSCTVALLIIYLSISSADQQVEKILFFEGQDKLAHGIMYAMLTFVLCRDFFRRKISFPSWKMYVAAVVFPIIYGGVIEIVQQNFFPPRTGDWWDWLADIIGVVLGYTIARFVVPRIVFRA